MEGLGAGAALDGAHILDIHAEVNAGELGLSVTVSVTAFRQHRRSYIDWFSRSRRQWHTDFFVNIDLRLTFICSFLESGDGDVGQDRGHGRLRGRLRGRRFLNGRQVIVVGVFVVLVRACLHHALPHALQVDLGEEVVEALAAFLELHEELLGVAAGLRARAGAHVHLHALPLLAVLLERLDEAEVLVHGPAARLLRVGLGAGNGRRLLRVHGKALPLVALQALGGRVAGFVFHGCFAGGQGGLAGRNLRVGEEGLLRVLSRAFSG